MTSNAPDNTAAAVGRLPATRMQAGNTAMVRLLILFTLSGAAGLIYELVWFQLLRLTIGASSHSLGVLLACFMGGLCIGSLSYARVVPRHWHPLKTYAAIEVAIAVFGLALPYLLSGVKTLYFSQATTPLAALAWRSAISVLALLPPTIMMGATLPALARWVRADDRQASQIGRLYASNVVGAVAGVFLAALVLLPALGLVGSNLVAVGLNLAVAALALTIRGRYEVAPAEETPELPASRERSLIYIAYAMSGMAALSFEVLWARLMGSVFGATVYAFALVLGMFLLGLAIGGAAGSTIVRRRVVAPRIFVQLQLLVIAAAGATSYAVPRAAEFLVMIDIDHVDSPVILTLTNLARSAVVVLPAAICWGMMFPVAVACLGSSLPDAARPVGRLYALNTIGAVLGSLATSFLLIPRYGTAMGASHLVLLPLAAAVIMLWPRTLPAWSSILAGAAAAIVAFGTDWPTQAARAGLAIASQIDSPMTYLIMVLLPAFLGFELFLVKRAPTRLIVGAAITGLAFAYTAAVPAELYKLGRRYGHSGLVPDYDGEIVLFEEGAMEPVVVYRSSLGPLEVSINSMLCASTVPDAMEHLRLLGHLPALLSENPADSIVIGLGAGVTAGCVGLHDRVERVQIVELEPKVLLAAAEFAEPNHNVLENPKVNVRIDDGRHFIATTSRKFGVITSDPIEPFWAGSAALYTVEHYRRCRDRLVDGGVFCQWLGIFGLDEDNIRSLLAAFAEAFPEGSVWGTPSEMILIGSTGPVRFDIPLLRKRLASEKQVAESLEFVGIRSIEELMGRYICSVASLRDYLAGAKPTRDHSLTVQYTGWQAFYHADRSSLWRDRVRKVLIEHRRIDRADFILPADDTERFFARIDEEWQEFVDPSLWPGTRPADPVE